MMSILSLLCTTGTAQISQIDSNHVSVEIAEFKHIILTNIQAKYLWEARQLDSAKFNQLEGVITSKDSVIATVDDNVRILREQLDEQSPGFFDHFFIAYPAGVLTVLAVVMLMPK